jgi:hypothetical protein
VGFNAQQHCLAAGLDRGVWCFGLRTLYDQGHPELALLDFVAVGASSSVGRATDF